MLAFPTETVKSYYIGRPDIVFLDQSGVTYFKSSNGCRSTYQSFSDITIGEEQIGDYQEVFSRIIWWRPVWYRWVANADQYELLTREAVFFVLKLMKVIRSLDIASAIFHTGVPHHVDSTLVEVACATAKIKQIYLYANSINGRLLPLQQHRSISDRKPLEANLSSYSASRDIDQYIDNKIRGGRPQVNESASFGQSYCNAIGRLVLAGFRGYAGSIFRNLTGRQHSAFPIKGAKALTTIDHLRLMREQRAALKYYLSQVRDDLMSLNQQGTQDGPVILIAAHFQPEATTFPEGGDFSNHVDIVAKIRQVGYRGVILYKEHPGTFMYYSRIVGGTRVGMSRSVSYYKQLLALGCVFVSPDFHLSIDPKLSSWYIPLTITGSIALERSLSGLSTITAGYPWYRGLPGVVDLSQVKDLSRSLSARIHLSGEVRDEAKVFLSSLLNNRTIKNIAGIGTGVTLCDRNSIDEFFQEFDSLLCAAVY